MLIRRQNDELAQTQPYAVRVAPKRVNRNVANEMIGEDTGVRSFAAFVKNNKFPGVFVFLWKDLAMN